MEQQVRRRGFASDNNAGIHPAILKAIIEANAGHVVGYGDDSFTKKAEELFQKHFGEGSRVFFVFGGTAANVLSIQAATRPHNAVICADCAHINVDECGAPEKFSGCKLIPIPTRNGKISVEQIKPHLHAKGVPHHNQPKLISITQPTEYGVVYADKEIFDLAEFAHDNCMFLHMDGARLANAAYSLGVLSLRVISFDLGVDILSFGGTKCGMAYGDAVVLSESSPFVEDLEYIRKQSAQLASKMRFISAQFIALLKDRLWHELAQQANEMAWKLKLGLEPLPGVQITQSVDTNAVFLTLPKRVIPPLKKKFFFYEWNPLAWRDGDIAEIRLMCSFDTTEEDVSDFVETLRSLL